MTDSNILYDQCDTELVSPYKWRINKHGYVICNADYVDGKRKVFYMHKLIMPCPAGFQVDHINGCKTDNRRSNLRLVTPSQNMMNRKGIKGYHKSRNKFRACIQVDGKRVDLGHFVTESEAAKAYEIASLKYFGSFSKMYNGTTPHVL